MIQHRTHFFYQFINCSLIKAASSRQEVEKDRKKFEESIRKREEKDMAQERYEVKSDQKIVTELPSCFSEADDNCRNASQDA